MTRETRQEVVAEERRRRSAGTLDRMQHLKLAIPEKVRQENQDYALRWINDQGNRMYFMTEQDDWNVVDGVEPIPVGTGVDNKPILARLCRKKREWFEADQREKVEATRQTERSLVSSAKSDPQDDRPDNVSYVVPGNTISGFTP